jgi:pyruvate dehydrogenase E2 component (dihydrolipoamide acetyltransferase)
MLEFKLPAIGEGVVEGEIVRWLKQPGDAVAANEGLVEVMTDKATVEIPSPHAGVVQKIVAEEGAIAAVGETIAVLDSNGASSVSGSANVASAPSPSTTPTQAMPKVANPSVELPTPPGAIASHAASEPGRSANDDGRVLATPAARALARESGIDLATLPAARGRITKSDVVAATQAPRPTPAAASHVPARSAAPQAEAGELPPGPQTEKPSRLPTEIGKRRPGSEPVADEWIPFRGMRRRIAEGMAKAYSTAVHYTYVEQIDVTRLVDVRNQARQAAKEEGVSLNYLPFIMKAVIRGLKKYPIVNSYLDEAAGHIVVRRQYNLGIATATDNGLMVPVVHDADHLSLLDLASEVQRVSEAARTGKATLAELTGSTFTITSLGAIGGLLATPILNYPEVGILGVHAIRKQPVVGENDEIKVGYVMNLSVSLDHRIVDGFEGASFLQEVRRYLEDPTLLLLAGI